MKHVLIENYKWEGRWGLFRIKTRCSECDLNTTILKNMLVKEFKGRPVKLEIKPWLNNWYSIIFRGGWHAPIVLVNKRLFSQGVVIDRNKLNKRVKQELQK